MIKNNVGKGFSSNIRNKLSLTCRWELFEIKVENEEIAGAFKQT